mmetsp:Transcript_4253/g.6536  ORF Transcript_4253/g.6536 Transcript_4253/m.6536 type:complete len:135 (-) Transcript_4253:387-791(-)
MSEEKVKSAHDECAIETSVESIKPTSDECIIEMLKENAKSTSNEYTIKMSEEKAEPAFNQNKRDWRTNDDNDPSKQEQPKKRGKHSKCCTYCKKPDHAIEERFFQNPNLLTKKKNRGKTEEVHHMDPATGAATT